MTASRATTDKKHVLKFAGAYIAWVIGSGFATGQEILQFFTSYGYASYLVVLLNLAGFLLLGKTILAEGFEHKKEAFFDHYRFYCGLRIGRIYALVVPATLLLIMSVLIAGAGATLSQFYGINRHIGSAVMSAAVLAAYLVGFEKMVRVVSMIGPAIIVFTLFVGAASVFQDCSRFGVIGDNLDKLASSQVAPHWILSAALYMSLNFLCSSPYYTAVGRSAGSRSEAAWGAICGTLSVICAIAIMNTAILLNADDTATLSVPTLYLAKKISYAFGAIFSVVLMLGIFSSCSTMMWSFCTRLAPNNPRKNRIASITTAGLTFALGLFPFSGLISIIYPFIGYLGLYFIACVLIKGLHGQTARR